MAPLPPRLQSLARRATGATFVATGALKILIWPRFFAFCVGMAAPGAAPPQVLGVEIGHEIGRVAWAATGLAVPPLEVACGILLWRGGGRGGVRVASALLAVDMLGAILSVGIPGRLGHSTDVSGHKVGAEPWRLPLEAALLLACAWIASRPEPGPAST